MAFATKSDVNDLDSRLAVLENYVQMLEKRLDGQHQDLTNSVAEELGNIHDKIGSNPQVMERLHKMARSRIVDVDEQAELEEQLLVEETERVARGEC
jgi:hypothetical protein